MLAKTTAAAALILLTACATAEPAPSPASGPGVFEEAWSAVNELFLDPDFNGVDWEAMRASYGPIAAAASDREARAAVINAMLAELETSHTRLYTPDEPAYYELLGVFLENSPQLVEAIAAAGLAADARYVGVGAVTQEIDGVVFVRAVLDGSPAAVAGLVAGDRIVAVEDEAFHPIRSFEGREGRPTTIAIQRSSDPASRRDITVTPRTFDGRDMFLEAMQASVAVVEADGAAVGYVHVWSYAGAQYQAALETELLYGRLKDADALVLDVREGWGGASPTYLNLFTARTLTMATAFRGGAPTQTASGWSRPVVLLVNGESRSGKEVLARGFRSLGIGPVVGERTAGAVVAGMPMALSDGSLLYIAVGDALVDGERIEGVGVAPDVEVPFTIPYAQGADPQKERAIAVAAELAGSG